jgi:hypothetical protein
MAMIKCPECGSDISNSAISCPKCGLPIKKGQSSGPIMAKSEAKEILSSSEEKAYRKLIIWGVALTIVIIIAVLIYRNNQSLINGWFFHNDHGLPSQLQADQYVPKVHTQNIVQGSIIAKAGLFRYYEITIRPDAYNNRISGRFHASGGIGNDIRVLVMKKDDYINFVNGHAASSFYDSGQTTVSDVNVQLPSGVETYVLVFDNTFSILTDKEVDTKLDLVSTY